MILFEGCLLSMIRSDEVWNRYREWHREECSIASRIYECKLQKHYKFDDQKYNHILPWRRAGNEGDFWGKGGEKYLYITDDCGWIEMKLPQNDGQNYRYLVHLKSFAAVNHSGHYLYHFYFLDEGRRNKCMNEWKLDVNMLPELKIVLS